MDDDSSQRSSRRDSLFLLAELASAQGRPIATIRVRNLSATGLMADCATALAEGDRVTVAMRGVDAIAATVSWSRGGRTGLQFVSEIDPQAVRRSVGSASGIQKRPGGSVAFKARR